MIDEEKSKAVDLLNAITHSISTTWVEIKSIFL